MLHFLLIWILLTPFVISLENKTEFAGDRENVVSNDNSPPLSLIQNSEHSQESKPSLKPTSPLIYLPSNYNKLLAPKYDDGFITLPVEVQAFFNILSMRDLDEVKGEISILIKLSVMWQDQVILAALNGSAGPARNDLKTVSADLLKEVWTPDLYITDLTAVSQPHLLTRRQDGLEYSRSNALFYYTTQLTVSVHCDFDFAYYPADTQNCLFSLQSFLYLQNNLILNWMSPPGVFLENTADENFDIAVTAVSKEEIYPRIFSKKSAYAFDSLQFVMSARRKLSYHVTQTYMPSIFFILITILCFFIPSNMVEARIGIAMTTLLTLTAMFSSIRESGPIESYVKAIDFWMIFCIIFVFLVLLEFTVLCWIERKRRAEQAGTAQDDPAQLEDLLEKNNGDLKVGVRKSPPKLQGLVDFVERHAFILTLCFVLAFVILYWTTLILASDYFSFTVNPEFNNLDTET